MSLARVCLPILAGCALISAVSLLCSEVLAPPANRRSREIERLRVRPGKLAAQFSGTGTGCAEGGILSAQVVDAPSRSLQGSSTSNWTGSSARCGGSSRGRPASFRWRLELREGKERRFADGSVVEAFDLRTYRFPETIEGFLEGETPRRR